VKARRPRLWWLPVLAVVGVGCAVVKRTTTIETYRLDYSATSPTGSPLPLIIRVPPMEVSPTYDRDPIVYREGEYTVGSYYYYRWSSNPGSMIADLLARDIAASGLYRDVQTAVSVTPPDYQLKGTVEEIEEHFMHTNCTAYLRLRITLSASRGAREERVRFTKLYAAEETCRCDDPQSIVESMSRGMASISAEIQADLYRNLAQQGSRPDKD